MEPVPLFRKPDNVSKTQLRDFLCWPQFPQKIQRPWMALKPSSTPLHVEIFNGRCHALCPRADTKSSENSPQCSHAVKGTTAPWAPALLHYPPTIPNPGRGWMPRTEVPRDEEAVPAPLVRAYQPWRTVPEVEARGKMRESMLQTTVSCLSKLPI